MANYLARVSNYFKTLVIPQMPDGFVVAEPFRHGLSDDELKKGMEAFRDFLYAMFDKIIEDSEKIDTKKARGYDPRGTVGDRGTASVKEHFPVFNDLTIILLTLGYHGKLVTEHEKKLVIFGGDMQNVIDPITEKYKSFIQMSAERKLEMFNLLSEIGLRFEGADFSREVDFSEHTAFEVSRVENDYFPVGLKLIAQSMINNKDYYKLENLFGSVLRRGDFYSLANVKPKKVIQKISEYANAQPPEIKEWVINIDKLLTQNGCKAVQGMGGGSPFTYTKRSGSITYGMVCIIEMGIAGAFVIPGVNHLENSDSICNVLPDNLAALIKSGEDNAKFNPEHCHRRSGNMGFARFAFTHKGIEYEGCRHAGLRCQFSGVKCRFSGYKFDLYDTVVRDLMTKWIEMELSV